MYRIVSTVEARIGSSRLPGKTMKQILGKPTLQLLLERLMRARTIDQIVVATTTNPEDDVIEEFCDSFAVSVFRGSSEDVLDRVEKAARESEADIVVEITGDCILTDPEVVDSAVKLFLNSDYDYISNLMMQTYPQGVDVRVFWYHHLKKINEELAGDDPDAREHVTLYFEEHPELYKIFNMSAPQIYHYPEWRLDLDYEEDLKLLTIIFEGLYIKNREFTLKQLIDFLEKNQHLKKINCGAIRKPLRKEEK